MAKKSARKKERDKGRPGAVNSAQPEKPADQAPRASWKPLYTRVTLGLILSFSLGLGLVCVIQFRQSPFFDHPIIDEYDFVDWARQIAEGDVLGHEVFYLDPLYPYTMALIFKIFGTSFLAVRLFQVALGVAGVALVFWTGRKLGGDGVGLAAAGLLAWYRGVYFFELLLLKASMVVFFSALSCAVGVLAVERPDSRRRWVLLGFSLGLLTLLRGNFQALLPFAVIFAFLYDGGGPRRARLARAIYTVTGIALVIVPVTVRNYVVADEIVATRLGGANFYIGNSEYADGSYVKLPFVRAHPLFEDPDFEAEASRRAGRKLTPLEANNYWFNEGVRWIKEHPADAARLWLTKARLMVHQLEVPDNQNVYVIRDEFVPALWVPFIGFGMLWGSALVGVWVMARRDKRSWYPALFMVLYPASIIPFFIVDRYRMAVVPAMCLFAAGFWSWAIERIRQGNSRVLTLPAAVIAVSLLISFLPMAGSRAPRGQDYYTIGNVYCSIGEPSECISWYDKAIANLPATAQDLKTQILTRRGRAMEIISILGNAGEARNAPELIGMGDRLMDLGQARLAAEVYELAAGQDPASFEAHARLGLLYCNHEDALDLPKGLARCETADHLQPGDPDVMCATAYCHYWSGEKETARREWENILKRYPDYAPARQALERPAKLGERR